MKEVELLADGVLNKSQGEAFQKEFDALFGEAYKNLVEGKPVSSRLFERINNVLQKGVITDEFVGLYGYSRVLQKNIPEKFYLPLFSAVGVKMFSGAASSKDPAFQLLCVRAGRAWLGHARSIRDSETFHPVELKNALEGLINSSRNILLLTSVSAEFRRSLYLLVLHEALFLLSIIRNNEAFRNLFPEENVIPFLRDAAEQTDKIWTSDLRFAPGEAIRFWFHPLNIVLEPGALWVQCQSSVLTGLLDHIHHATSKPDLLDAHLLLRAGLALTKTVMRELVNNREVQLLDGAAYEFKDFFDYLTLASLLAIKNPENHGIKFLLKDAFEIIDEFKFIEFIRPHFVSASQSQTSDGGLKNKERLPQVESGPKTYSVSDWFTGVLLSASVFLCLKGLFLFGIAVFSVGAGVFLNKLLTNHITVEKSAAEKALCPLHSEPLRDGKKIPNLWISYYFCEKHGILGFPPFLYIVWGTEAGPTDFTAIPELTSLKLKQILEKLKKGVKEIYNEGDEIADCANVEEILKNLTDILIPAPLLKFLSTKKSEFAGKQVLAIIPSKDLYHVPFELLGGTDKSIGNILGREFDIRYQPYVKILTKERPSPARFSKIAVWPTRKTVNLPLDSFAALAKKVPGNLFKVVKNEELSPGKLLGWMGRANLFRGRGDIALCFHGIRETDTAQIRIFCDRNGMLPEEMISLLSTQKFENSIKDRTVWLLSCAGAEGKASGIDAFMGWGSAFLWGQASTTIMHSCEEDVLRLRKLMEAMATHNSMLEGAVAYKRECFTGDSWTSRVSGASVRIFQLS